VVCTGQCTPAGTALPIDHLQLFVSSSPISSIVGLRQLVHLPNACVVVKYSIARIASMLPLEILEVSSRLLIMKNLVIGMVKSLPK
jgi:hypothetical protein